MKMDAAVVSASRRKVFSPSPRFACGSPGRRSRTASCVRRLRAERVLSSSQPASTPTTRTASDVTSKSVERRPSRGDSPHLQAKPGPERLTGARAQFSHRDRVKPGDESLPQREYLPDLTEGQLLAIVQRDHQPLFHRKRVDR